MSHSPSPAPTPLPSASRHATNAADKQRMQLERLLKDPSKPAYIPPPPKEKVIRPPRDMMKNVQGSSAGAGSGEFHVYKASRRREYERLKALGDEAAKAREETEVAEFEARKRQREEEAEAKTAKNRAKRQKKKERAKAGKGTEGKEGTDGKEGGAGEGRAEPPLKKKRLVNGAEVVFRKPGEGSEGEDDEVRPAPSSVVEENKPEAPTGAAPAANGPKITIVDED
ncbi:hypothetical protein K488DRAFT_70609 [Vararia minispora EC-137]|uniref:Uncharacterized protein n=1 Tax=Vararia minispora EC-137 TaxID=1314806 RepID=A0ACB8QKV2_9AGAM|nr:hypothetical protein K488DRAFT_70609 [Vararia minispora EC-137]